MWIRTFNHNGGCCFEKKWQVGDFVTRCQEKVIDTTGLVHLFTVSGFFHAPPVLPFVWRDHHTFVVPDPSFSQVTVAEPLVLGELCLDQGTCGDPFPPKAKSGGSKGGLWQVQWHWVVYSWSTCGLSVDLMTSTGMFLRVKLHSTSLLSRSYNR